jgi:hypothetical protein
MKIFDASPLFYLINTLLVCLFICSCSTGGDYSEEISGGYFYRSEGADTKDILSHLPNGNNIYSKVVSYDYNSNFIIAAQQPIYNEYRSMIGFELRNDLSKYPSNSETDMIKSEVIADSILKNDPFYRKVFSRTTNYWIIDHTRNLFLGPLSFEEYEKKRKDLGVPDDLQLKLESSH